MTYVPVSYRSGGYIMTANDFNDGCFIHTENGKLYGTGETSFGYTVTLPLNVPLCAGCDREIVNGKCDACEQVFVGDPICLFDLDAETMGDPLLRRVA